MIYIPAAALRVCCVRHSFRFFADHLRAGAGGALGAEGDRVGFAGGRGLSSDSVESAAVERNGGAVGSGIRFCGCRPVGRGFGRLAVECVWVRWWVGMIVRF